MIGNPSASTSKRPLQNTDVLMGLHVVGHRHYLKLVPCRLAVFADIDRFCERQVTDLEELPACRVVLDAADPSIADHGFLPVP